MHSTPKKSNKSRIESLGDDLTEQLPDVDDYVVSVFYQLGMCSRGGMSIHPLSWSELKAYSDLTGSEVNAWEAENVIMMSRQYCLWNRKGSELTCPSPWFNDTEQAMESNRERVANAMKAIRRNKAS